jgi:hypothetical protein
VLFRSSAAADSCKAQAPSTRVRNKLIHKTVHTGPVAGNWPTGLPDAMEAGKDPSSGTSVHQTVRTQSPAVHSVATAPMMFSTGRPNISPENRETAAVDAVPCIRGAGPNGASYSQPTARSENGADPSTNPQGRQWDSAARRSFLNSLWDKRIPRPVPVGRWRGKYAGVCAASGGISWVHGCPFGAQKEAPSRKRT